MRTVLLDCRRGRNVCRATTENSSNDSRDSVITGRVVSEGQPVPGADRFRRGHRSTNDNEPVRITMATSKRGSRRWRLSCFRKFAGYVSEVRLRSLQPSHL